MPKTIRKTRSKKVRQQCAIEFLDACEAAMTSPVLLLDVLSAGPSDIKWDEWDHERMQRLAYTIGSLRRPSFLKELYRILEKSTWRTFLAATCTAHPDVPCMTKDNVQWVIDTLQMGSCDIVLNMMMWVHGFDSIAADDDPAGPCAVLRQMGAHVTMTVMEELRAEFKTMGRLTDADIDAGFDKIVELGLVLREV